MKRKIIAWLSKWVRPKNHYIVLDFNEKPSRESVCKAIEDYLFDNKYLVSHLKKEPIVLNLSEYGDKYGRTKVNDSEMFGVCYPPR